MAPASSQVNLVWLAYDAVASGDGWYPFLAQLKEQARADRVALLARTSSHGGLSETCSSPRAAAGPCRRCGGPPWPAPPRVAEVGSVRATRQQCAGVELQTLTVAVCDACTKGCTIGLARASEPFPPAVHDLLAQLVPHVQRVLGIRRSVDQSRCLHQAALATINRLPYGVLFLDEDGSVIVANEAAKSTFARFDGLRIDHGHLTASDHRQQSALRQLLGAAARPSPASADRHWTMGVTDTSGETTLLATLCAVDGAQDSMFERQARVAVFLFDPRCDPRIDEPLLMRAYGLTKAEARIAAQIAAGRTLEAAALRLGVSVHTVRTHLHRIFSKTGTSRQADLMRLLLLAFVRG